MASWKLRSAQSTRNSFWEVSKTYCSKERPGKAAVLPGPYYCSACRCPHVRGDSFITSPTKGSPLLVLKGSDVLNINDVLELNIFVGWSAWFCHVHRSVDGELWKSCWNKLSFEERLWTAGLENGTLPLRLSVLPCLFLPRNFVAFTWYLNGRVWRKLFVCITGNSWLWKAVG